MKENLKFSDGSPITTRDIELAVLRMANARPRFPVLEKIEGLEAWTKTPFPLEGKPTGIVTSKNEITIQFSSAVENPLVRFTLELFSIIPAKCIDLKTSAITCSKIPSSGPYVIDSDDGKTVAFKTREFNSTEFDHIPERIRFKYALPKEISPSLKSLDENSIIAGNQLQYEPEILSQMESGGKIASLPTARFATLQINPNFKPLKEASCRMKVATKFREVFARLGGNTITAESSIFTKLLPGYLPAEKLKANSAGNDHCGTFAENEVSVGYAENERDTLFLRTLFTALKELGIHAKEKVYADRKLVMEAFGNNEIAFMSISSGFWAFDFAGDLQMLFTPNLHKPLRFSSEDQKLQQLISDAKKSGAPAAFEKVNQYLYDQALFNVYAHSRRFYWARNKSLLKEAAFSSTAPAPWQVFE